MKFCEGICNIVESRIATMGITAIILFPAKRNLTMGLPLMMMMMMMMMMTVMMAMTMMMMMNFIMVSMSYSSAQKFLTSLHTSMHDRPWGKLMTCA